MKLVRLTCASLAVAALALAACTTKTEASTSSTGHAADSMAKTPSADLSKAAPDAAAAKAQGVLDDLGKQLAAVKDTQTAKDLVAKFQPQLDQLSQAAAALSAHKFDTTSLKSAIDAVTAKFKDNKEVMAALQPLLDKLHTWVK